MKILVDEGLVIGLDRRFKHAPSSVTRLIGSTRDGRDGALVRVINDLLGCLSFGPSGCCPKDPMTGRRARLLGLDAWEIPNTPERTEVTLLKAVYDSYNGKRGTITQWVLVWFNNNRETRRAYARGADLNFACENMRKVKVLREIKGVI